MTSSFALLCQACGLSYREAAEFLDCRPDTVRSWITGRRTAPEAVLGGLAALHARIETTADEASDVIAGQAALGEIELGISADDHEAQSLGWPCVGTHRAVLAIVAARAIVEGHSVRIVPRGSTAATAAAADQHDR